MCPQLQSLDGTKPTGDKFKEEEINDFTAMEEKIKRSRETDSKSCSTIIDGEKISKKAKLEDTMAVEEDMLVQHLFKTETNPGADEAEPVPRSKHKSRASKGPSGLVSIKTIKRRKKSPSHCLDLFKESTELPSWN